MLWRAEALGHEVDPTPIRTCWSTVRLCGGKRQAAASTASRFPPAAAMYRSPRASARRPNWSPPREIRRLGVAIERLVLHDPDLLIEAPHRDPALSAPVRQPTATLRWRPQTAPGKIDFRSAELGKSLNIRSSR